MKSELIDLLIVGALVTRSMQEATATEIADVIEPRLSRPYRWIWSAAFLYPSLVRLERRGILKSRWDRPSADLRRRLYSVDGIFTGLAA